MTRSALRIALVAAALALLGCQSRRSAPSPAATASDVIRGYYAAIEKRDYRGAYEAWADSGAASGKTFEQYESGFAQTAHASVEITGPEEPEGAAGSIYARVAVVVHATTTWGANQNFVGSYTLKRVNDVPGATRYQLRWHIRSADLKPAS